MSWLTARARRVRILIRRHVFRNVTSVVALLGMFVLATYITVYILDHQGLRLPLIDERPWTLQAEFATARAVIPGQGQTVRVSGIRIGDVSGVELRDGRALVTMDMDQKYRRLVHRDATALLRPKTELKDMFIELDPGRAGGPVREGHVIPLRSTLPDVSSDEVLSMLDRDTRDYVKLLLNGLGEGLHKRGYDFGEVMRRLEPTHRDIARVSTAVARRRDNLRRVVNHLARLNQELASQDDQLARLVSESSVVFRALSSEERNISRTVRGLPPALRETTSALGKVENFATVLRPTAQRLRPVFRKLTASNEILAPSARAITPIVREQIRPLVREAQPLVRDLRRPAGQLAEATPFLTRTVRVVNRVVNLLAFNPRGRERPGVPDREEGYLFWFAWLGHQGVNLFSSSDAHGTFRPFTFGGTCNSLKSALEQNPEYEFLFNLTPIITSSAACGGETFPRLQKSPAMANRRQASGGGR